MSDVSEFQTLKRLTFDLVIYHIPKVRNFSSFKKEQWTRPLDPQRRAKIAKNTDYGHGIWKHEMLLCLKNTNLCEMQLREMYRK